MVAVNLAAGQWKNRKPSIGLLDGAQNAAD
jgi:hypothetical protein